jgi:hypothetical protein
MACGHFSDIGFVTAGKKRGFCRLRNVGQRKSDTLLVDKKNRPAAIFPTSASLPPAKSVVFAGCATWDNASPTRC